MTNGKNLKKISAIFALMAIPAAGLAGCAPSTDTSSSVTPPAQTTDNNGSSTTTAYKDGTFTATGNYISPAGPQHVDVSLTLNNGVITASTVNMGAEGEMSVRMQTMFINNYKPQVEGKNIDSIHLTRVSGSSLTPIGFNDALSKIKTEAQA